MEHFVKLTDNRGEVIVNSAGSFAHFDIHLNKRSVIIDVREAENGELEVALFPTERNSTLHQTTTLDGRHITMRFRRNPE